MGATILGFALGEPILRALHSSLAIIGIDGGEFLLLRSVTALRPSACRA